MKAYFQSNPFWVNKEKTEAMSIYTIEKDDGTVENRQQPVPKNLPDGSVNPLWTQLLAEIGEDRITKNTDIRRKTKLKEKNETDLKKNQRERSAGLEHLFGLKLKAFEIKEVRECTDKALRTKIRGSKSDIEMNAWIAVVLLKSLEIDNDESK
jgi:hypothetical protein